MWLGVSLTRSNDMVVVSVSHFMVNLMNEIHTYYIHSFFSFIINCLTMKLLGAID